jgi:mannose-6-phosphate isomerase-like protein (cupin superfamily)
VAFRVVRPDELEWTEREPEAGGQPARYVARLSDVLEFAHTRGSMWRYPLGAKGRRHRDLIQEETFVVLDGTLTMYLGDPPERVDVPKGGVVHVESGTVLQLVNHGDQEVHLYAYGAPPETGGAEFLDSAV